MAEQSTRKRNEIDEKYKWDLAKIYVNETLWEEDFQTLQQKIKAIAALQGTMPDSAEALLKVLQTSHEMGRITEKLYVYARMRRDENNADQNYQALFDRAERLSVEASSAAAYIVPEILAIPEQT